MPRPSQQLHPAVPTLTPRLAATVLLLRDGPQGMEVLMTRRSAKASFAASLYVFPGGAVDAADAEAPKQPGLVHQRSGQGGEQLTWALAALRESFEEVGVLLARRADGSPATQVEVDQLDASIGRRNTAEAFYQACAQMGLQLMVDQVFVLARWIGPLDIPKRFDTPFLVARMPAGQTVQTDEHEQFQARWVRPAEALELHEKKQFAIMFPTERTLRRIAHFETVDALLDACSEEPLWTYCPRGALDNGKEARIVNDELAFGEIGLVTPHGQVAHTLEWQHERPVPLLRNVRRLTAPNANRMTGPGTNSYIVGTEASGYAVIDPGPALDTHQQKLLEATGGDVRLIICTHSHPDHSPGAVLLQQLCAMMAEKPTPPIYGVPHGPDARADSQFLPDEVLADGQTLLLEEPDGTRHTLQAILTPGHTANHVCLALLEDELLFSGDHILNGSTTIIDPPDGNMGDYLASLDKLERACEEQELEFILPAHGYAMQHATTVIEGLRAHRLAREARVAAAMEQLPDGAPEDWVPLAYSDTPEALWPLARRSLIAHVEHIRAKRGEA